MNGRQHATAGVLHVGEPDQPESISTVAAHPAADGREDVVVVANGERCGDDALAALCEPIQRGEADLVIGRPADAAATSLLGTALELAERTAVRSAPVPGSHAWPRAYALSALRRVSGALPGDDGAAHATLALKFQHEGLRILEVSIDVAPAPPRGVGRRLRDTRGVLTSAWRYRRTVGGASCAPEYAEYFPHYPFKEAPGSSHSMALARVGTGNRVLDVGCGEGEVAARAAQAGNEVWGTDFLDVPARLADLSGYAQADLTKGLVDAADMLGDRTFDRILVLDVLEHLPDPGVLLDDIQRRLAPGGRLIVSLPNVANVTVRLGLLAGRFDYADRGIMDRTHMRFFTRRSARDLMTAHGLSVVEQADTVMPVEVALGLSADSSFMRAVNAAERAATRLLPGLLGYQTITVSQRSGDGDG